MHTASLPEPDFVLARMCIDVDAGRIVIRTEDTTGGTFDEQFVITVNDVNVAPVLGAIGNQTVDELATLTFTATATDSDLPADTLTFSLDAGSIALGMSIDANTGVFSWTPTEGQGGLTPSVTVTVTDNGNGNLVDSETFTITVNGTNTAPVLNAIGNQTVDELATLSFTVTATDADLPADTLSFSLDAASIALGMTIDANSGAFSWTPGEGQGDATHNVTVTVSDGITTDSQTFAITVNELNDAPVLNAIADQSVDEGATLSFSASATDGDLPAQALSYSLDAASTSLGMTIDANTGAFSWTPGEDQGGVTHNVTVTVSDGSATDSQTFALTVNELNDAPALNAIANQSIDEGATLSFTASASDTDLPAQTLSYSLDAASTTLGMTIDANTGAFSWTPTEAQGGLTPNVTVTVSDGITTDSQGFTSVITVNVTVDPVDDGNITQTLSISTDEDTAFDLMYAMDFHDIAQYEPEHTLIPSQHCERL